MPRRVLWLPEYNFRKRLAQTLKEIEIIDPEPVDELHATVSGAWANDYEVRGDLEPPITGLIGPVILKMQSENDEWKKLVIAVMCKPMEELHIQLKTMSKKVGVKPFSPHITLSRTMQDLSREQVSALQFFVGESVKFDREVRETPGREKQRLYSRLSRQGVIAPRAVFTSAQNSA